MKEQLKNFITIIVSVIMIAFSFSVFASPGIGTIMGFESNGGFFQLKNPDGSLYTNTNLYCGNKSRIVSDTNTYQYLGKIVFETSQVSIDSGTVWGTGGYDEAGKKAAWIVCNTGLNGGSNQFTLDENGTQTNSTSQLLTWEYLTGFLNGVVSQFSATRICR